MVTKNELIEMLKERIINVKFTKTDGSVRSMKCTLNEKIVPSYENKSGREKNINNNIVVVWDTEKEDWRSFRYDSVIEVL